jgi:hypothetical protein
VVLAEGMLSKHRATKAKTTGKGARPGAGASRRRQNGRQGAGEEARAAPASRRSRPERVCRIQSRHDQDRLITGATWLRPRQRTPFHRRRLAGDRHRRRQDRLQALRDELGDAPAPAAFDIRGRSGDARRARGAAERFRGIDLLVNNAGLAQGTKPAQDVAVRLANDDRDQHHRAGNADPRAVVPT